MIVVDTQILIWDALAPERLSGNARAALARAQQSDGLLVADISLWEIAMLIQKGRLTVPTDVRTFLTLVLQSNPITVECITPQIAALSTQLPPSVNADPADRLITATALVNQIPLVTSDRNLRDFDELTTIW